MTPRILNSVMESVEKAMDTAQPQKAAKPAAKPVVEEIERILDEESAWVALPNAEVTKRIALRATLAAQCVMTELALFDAREAMIEGTITPEKASDILDGLKGLSESAVFTQEARDLFKAAHGLIERTVIIDYESAIAAATELRKERDRLIDELSYADLRASGGLPEATTPAGTDDLVDRFAAALKEKLRAAEQKYGFSNDWLRDDWHGELIVKLLNHVQKGDPRDVAAYCAFAWHHGWSISPPQPNEGSKMTEAQIKHMVDRFLSWRLPADFNPDGGISFKRTFNEHTDHPMKHEPTGTNLLDGRQAKAMVRHMLEGLAMDHRSATDGAEFIFETGDPRDPEAFQADNILDGSGITFYMTAPNHGHSFNLPWEQVSRLRDYLNGRLRAAGKES